MSTIAAEVIECANDGLSQRQIAALLGENRKTVAAILVRAGIHQPPTPSEVGEPIGETQDWQPARNALDAATHLADLTREHGDRRHG